MKIDFNEAWGNVYSNFILGNKWTKEDVIEYLKNIDEPTQNRIITFFFALSGKKENSKIN